MSNKIQISGKEFELPLASSGQNIYDANDVLVCRVDENYGFARFIASFLNSRAEIKRALDFLIDYSLINDKDGSVERARNVLENLLEKIG